jgi:hypothetical protein
VALTSRRAPGLHPQGESQGHSTGFFGRCGAQAGNGGGGDGGGGDVR